VPKVFRSMVSFPRSKAAQQLFVVGDLLKRAIKDKFGEYVDTCTFGRAEIAKITATREGKGLKPVFVQVIKHFNVDRFYDSDYDYVFSIEDADKPVIVARRLRK